MGALSGSDADSLAADAAVSDSGLIRTITMKNALNELGLTFEQLKQGLGRRQAPHPTILKIVQAAGDDGLALIELRHQIKRELRLEVGVRGPYLLLYLRHFTSAYRIYGGPLPRDLRVAAFQQTSPAQNL